LLKISFESSKANIQGKEKLTQLQNSEKMKIITLSSMQKNSESLPFATAIEASQEQPNHHVASAIQADTAQQVHDHTPQLTPHPQDRIWRSYDLDDAQWDQHQGRIKPQND
jgi:hypothetical protein